MDKLKAAFGEAVQRRTKGIQAGKPIECEIRRTHLIEAIEGEAQSRILGRCYRPKYEKRRVLAPEKPMTWIGFLESVLNPEQIKDLREVLFYKNSVIQIKGPQIPTGKSVLLDVLLGLGYRAHEAYEVNEIELTTPIEDMRPNLAEELLSRREEIEAWINECPDLD